jgi:hypothetical protein
MWVLCNTHPRGEIRALAVLGVLGYLGYIQYASYDLRFFVGEIENVS